MLEVHAKTHQKVSSSPETLLTCHQLARSGHQAYFLVHDHPSHSNLGQLEKKLEDNHHHKPQKKLIKRIFTMTSTPFTRQRFPSDRNRRKRRGFRGSGLSRRSGPSLHAGPVYASPEPGHDPVGSVQRGAVAVQSLPNGRGTRRSKYSEGRH